MPALTIKRNTGPLLNAIVNLQDFNTNGAMWAVCSAPGGTGYLPKEFNQSVRAHRSQIDYTVYSYDTPIAWHLAVPGTDGMWVVPSVRYSNATSLHQSRVREALLGHSVITLHSQP